MALGNLHRAFDHASVVIDPIVDVLVGQVPVNLIPHLALLELHLVLRECASFVGEYEFHLAKFLNQIAIAAKCEIGIAWVRKDHLDITIDQLGLDQLEHLNDDIERDWDHMTVGDLIGEELYDPAAHIYVTLNVQVGLLVLIVAHPDQRQGREKADYEELEDKDRIQQFVHDAHQIGNFGRWFLLVHHDFGLVAHVKTDAKAEWSVFKRAAAKEKVFGTAWHRSADQF